MWLYTLVLLALAVFGLSDTVSMSTAETDSAQCTLTYNATQPPQIGPTTTIYQAIMTTFLYAVDCGICTVTNIPNAEIQGPFTTKSSSSMLTITMVQCMPTGHASTRLHDVAHQRLAAGTPQTATWNNLKDHKSSDLLRRSDQVTEAALVDLATSFSDALPADVSLLSGGLKDEFTNIASAMWALTVCGSGIDLHAACDRLGSVDVKYNLLQSWYNPESIQAIVCFCATYGLDFDTTRQQLYASLYAALIGILAASDVTTDRGQICDTLSLFNRTGPSLGINIQQYHDLVCKNIPSPTPTNPIWYGPTPIIPYVSNNMTTWGTPTSWLPNMTFSGTVGPISGSHNMTISGTGSATSGSPNTTISGTGRSTSGSPNMTISGTGSVITGSPNMTISGTGSVITGSPNMTISGTGSVITGSPNVTISGTGFPESNWTGNGSSTWGPPISFTGTIGSDWSITINPQTNWTDARPTDTAPAFDTDDPFETDDWPSQTDDLVSGTDDLASGTDDLAPETTLIAARTPRGPNAMPFYPAVPTSTTRPGLFRGY